VRVGNEDATGLGREHIDFNEICFEQDGRQLSEGPFTMNCQKNILGRFVTLQKIKPDDALGGTSFNRLYIVEVDVFVLF